MIKKITNRLGWKIIAVVAAFFLWLLVVSYEDPIITKDFNNLNVSKIKTDSITSQNKAIEYLEGEVVDVTVRGKRSLVERLSRNDIRAFADLSKVSITGAIDIEIELIDGVQVIEKRPGDMKIALENVITIQKEVQFYFDGEPKENYTALDPIITPSYIQISGPESQVNMVSSVVVPINIKGVERNITLYAAPQFLDSNKKEVTTVTANVDRVQVAVPIRRKKTIPIVFEQSDEITAGYRLTGVEFDVDSITIMGSDDALNRVDAVTINNIPLEGKTEDFSVIIDLQQGLLPGDVTILSEERTSKLTFKIAKIEEKTIMIDPLDITIRNLGEGLTALPVSDQPISIQLKGIEEDLAEISISTLRPYVSLQNLPEGQHAVTLNYIISSRIEGEEKTIEYSIENKEE